MTATMSWEERYRRLTGALPESTAPLTESIGITEMVVGDRVMWGGLTWDVTYIERDGPIVRVTGENQAVLAGWRSVDRGVRTVENEYLAIERVDVLLPRPNPAPELKGNNA